MKKLLIVLLATIASAVGVFMFAVFNQPAVPVWLSATKAGLFGLFTFVVPLALESDLPGGSR